MKLWCVSFVIPLLIGADVSWSEEASPAAGAAAEVVDSATAHLEQAEKYREQGDKWRACAEYAAAWQMAAAEETRDLETAVRVAGPYCQLLFDSSLLDPLWWVAEEALALAEELENPSPEVRRSIGWAHYWVLMRDRVLGELETGHQHASESSRIADEVNDPDLRAWTRLERSRLYILPQDAISAEVEILRCRAEPLYKTDIDYRSQCELRMEQTHLAGGRVEHAGSVVDKFLEGEEMGHHYKTESLYLLGKALREAEEHIRAVRPLCVGKWLHPEHGDWTYHCIINLNLLLEGCSPPEIFQLLELARGGGPRDATAAIDLEIASRFPEEEAGIEARARIDAATPGSVSPIMWEAIVRHRLSQTSDPEQIAQAYEDLVRRHPGNYQRLNSLVNEALTRFRGKCAPEFLFGFLERVRPHISECLYRSCRMNLHWGRREYAEAAEEARHFVEVSRDPRLYAKYPYLRIVTPHQHVTAHTYCIVAAFLADDLEGMQAGIEALIREAPDPVIIQRTFNRLAEHNVFHKRPELRLSLLNQVLAIDHSPVQRNRALVRKAGILRDMSKRAEAEDIYRTAISDDAYLEQGAYYIAEAYLHLAGMLRTQGRQAEAINLYQSMIARRDDLGEPVASGYVELVRLYLSIRAFDEAEKVADAGIEWLEGKGTHAYYRLQLLQGHILAARGEREAAIEVFRAFSTDRWPDWVRSQARQWLEHNGVAVP